MDRAGVLPNGTYTAVAPMHANGIPRSGDPTEFTAVDAVMSEAATAQAAGVDEASPTSAPDHESEGGSAVAPTVVPQTAETPAKVAEAITLPKDPLLEAFDTQQQAVAADPGDFNQWVSLISSAEKLADITRIRQVYDGFLQDFPLCFGYWKKYADAELKHTSIEAAVGVYERGVAAIAYSADLWGQYAVFKQDKGFSSGAVISVFERGAAIVGRDAAAHGFWDKYLRYAGAIKEPHRAASIYKRALGLSLKQLDKYMSGVTDFVEQHSVAELFPVPSQRAVLEAVAKQKKDADAKAAERAAAETQAAAAAEAAAAAAAAEAEAPPAAPAEEAAPLIGPPEAPRAAEPAAAAPQTPPTSSEAAVFPDPPANMDAQAYFGDQGGPVTPPPGSSSHSQPALGSAQMPTGKNSFAGAAAPGQEEGKADSPAAGIPAPTRGEAGPVAPQRASASGEGAAAEPQPMQVDSNGNAGSAAEPLAVSEAEVKEAWLASCRAIYESTKEEVTRRKAFEDVIRRPYFHVKPLDAAQLAAWSAYLDYMDAKGDKAETQHLFERCLVACARYTDFWLRYARYLEPRDVPAAKDAVRRGQGIHCKGISEMQLFAARFHERHGEISDARAAYGLVLGRLAPGLISAVQAAANFERRQGDRAAACAIYQTAISVAAEKGLEGQKAYAYLTVQYAQFLLVVYKDTQGARSVYSAALEKLPGSQTLWEGAIHLEQIVGATLEEIAKTVLAMYEKAIASADALPSDKEELSARACTFADMCGSAAMQEGTERRHAARIKAAADTGAAMGAAAAAKRPAEASAEAQSPSKQARTTSAAYLASTAYSAAAPAAAPAYSAAPYAVPAAPAGPGAPAAGYYGQPGYQYPGYGYPGYSQPGYPTYSYPQY